MTKQGKTPGPCSKTRGKAHASIHILSPLYLHSSSQAVGNNHQVFDEMSIAQRQRSNIFDPFSLDIWDPFHGSFPFESLGSIIGTSGGGQAALASTRVDWKETREAHVLKADLPGIKKEEVKVEVEEGRVLKISGERRREKEEEEEKGGGDTWHRAERSVGRFVRRFRLPENAKMEEVKASMENGVLTVVVPKEEVNKRESKAIEIDGGDQQKTQQQQQQQM